MLHLKEAHQAICDDNNDDVHQIDSQSTHRSTWFGGPSILMLMYGLQQARSQANPICYELNDGLVDPHVHRCPLNQY